jgi:penicillin-binding protein 1B
MTRREFVQTVAGTLLLANAPRSGEAAPSNPTAPDQFGTRVIATIDLDLQRLAEASVRGGLARLETDFPWLRRADPAARLQAVLIAIDVRTGEIRALVGGRDFGASQFNRALNARRQPGSAFKPFVYLTALAPRGGRLDFTPASIVSDEAIRVPVGGTVWEPRNYEGRMNLRRALAISSNSVAVQLALHVGLRAIAATAKAFGLGEPPRLPAVALGAFEVTPLQLATAYLALARQGSLISPTTIRRVVVDGVAQPWPRRPERPVAPPALAYLVTSLLLSVVESGTAASLRSLGVTGPVAGKTGTTDEGRDAWFIGYTTSLLVLVWVGFDRRQPHGLAGSQAAVPIFASFMRRALRRYPARPFTVPDGVVQIAIDPTTGARARAECPVVVSELFLAGTDLPPCPAHAGTA